MMFVRSLFACILVVLLSWVAPAHAAFKLSGPPKIAMVLFTPKNDGGWSQAFDEARQRMQKELGVSIALVDNVPEVASALRPAVELLVRRGFNIIIGTAYGYSDTLKELSEKYPQVAFLNGAGTTNGPNLEGFYGRSYESQYLCGMAAASVSKSGKLGFVAANPFGLVNWTVNAYALGAQQINPKATVSVVFTGAWDNAVKERAAAEALIDQGVDAIGVHVDTPATQIVAQERGVYSTGHHRDLKSFAPKATQCSSIWVWDHFLTPEIRKIQAGEWEPKPYGAFLSIKDGGPDIACCGPVVPKEIADRIRAERQAIVDGKMVFAGPLRDRDGKERVASGSTLSDADLWKMDWFVPGVISQK